MSAGYRKFLLLWTGELISSIGSGLTAFGLGVYVFRQTGSAAGMGLVTLLGFLPTLLLGVPAGILADRYDRRVLMMVGDGLSAVGVLYILCCMRNGGATLAQICTGVFISAVFSALLEPSYKATVTDLLSEEEFSRAGGLISVAGSARYLFAPVAAGFLLEAKGVEILLLLDIGTFLLTVAAAASVRKSIAKAAAGSEPFRKGEIAQGWKAIRERKGVLLLACISSGITLLLGILQILIKPLALSFADPKALGVIETVSACGMLASGLYLGIRGIRKHYVRVLALSVALSGIFMAGIGLFPGTVLMCVFGFLFFATLPLSNNCLDYLTRTNIPNEVQGRAFGLLGFISQIGYAAAYAAAGAAADGIAKILGTGTGRACGILVVSAGILLFAIAAVIPKSMAIRELEKGS